jgi:uncharacterized membrane protein YtjA (UPF0391 family)
MLDWTISFLIIAIIAGLLGFTGIAGTAVEMAKIIFVVSLVLWLAAIVVNTLRGKNPKDKM